MIEDDDQKDADMPDDGFAASVRRRLRRGYHAPRPMPKERIWAGIQQRRARAVRGTSITARRVTAILSIAAAAVVAAVGIRAVLEQERPRSPAPEASSETQGRVAADVKPLPADSVALTPPAVARALTSHFADAHVLLDRWAASSASVRGGQGDQPSQDTVTELLARTRLLRGVAAPLSSEGRVLLDDLEYVLAQVAQAGAALPGASLERELILAALSERRILARLDHARHQHTVRSQS